MKSKPLFAALVLLNLTPIAPAPAQAAPIVTAAQGWRLPAADAVRLNQAGAVVVATIVSVDSHDILESFPEQHVMAMTVAVESALRGEPPRRLSVSIHTVGDDPRPKAGDRLILGLVKEVQTLAMDGERPGIRWQITSHLPASAAAIAQARIVAEAPVGAAQADGQVSQTVLGRPAAAGPQRARLDVAQIAPETPVKWSNPYGDGKFKITVSNPTDEVIAVPGLWSYGGEILWSDSLIYVHRGEIHAMPGAKPLPEGALPARLAPGAAVSTVVDMLGVDFEGWAGGARERFTFAVGAQAATSFFYYHRPLHDPMRAAVRAQVKDL